MVVILACLSLVLTVGGGAMALYGADLLRSESGLALIQSGATLLGAGLLLAGLTGVLAELRRMRRLMEMDEEHLAVHVPHPGPAQPASPVRQEMEPRRGPELPASPEPAAPASPAVSVAPHPPVVAAPPPPPPPASPSPPVPSASSAPPVPAPKPASDEAGPAEPLPVVVPVKPPLPLPEPALGPRPAGSGIPAEARAGLVGAPGSGRFSRPASPPEPARPAAAGPAETHSGAAGEPSPTAGKPAELQAAEFPGDAPGGTMAAGTSPTTAGDRKMLATYNAGDITYFMYSDGSIEADMAGGRYRFTSMDELRGFIETGKGGDLVAPAPPAQPAA